MSSNSGRSRAASSGRARTASSGRRPYQGGGPASTSASGSGHPRRRDGGYGQPRRTGRSGPRPTSAASAARLAAEQEALSLDRALTMAMEAPAPAPTSFSELGLPAPLVAELARGGIREPFAIQSRALPDALAGRDVLGRAQTGSGKTLAFGLPMLARLAEQAAGPGRRQERAPRGLVLVPTRELALQVADVLIPLGHSLRISVMTVYGGVALGRQIDRLAPRRRHRRRHPRPADRPDGARRVHAGRCLGHGPRRGRPYGRPGLPAVGDPDTGRDQAAASGCCSRQPWTAGSPGWSRGT